MNRVALVAIAFIMVIPFLAPGVVIAQTATGGQNNVDLPDNLVIPPDNLRPPRGVGNPSDFPPANVPQYMVQPQENLDPFGLSTLDGTINFGKRGVGSTLGGETGRKSNLEVNKPREKKESAEQEDRSGEEVTATASEAEQPTAPSGAGESTDVTPEESDEVFSPSSPSVNAGGGIYKWVDKSGVIHITNDFGSVPPEYRGQLGNEPKKAEDEGSPQP